MKVVTREDANNNQKDYKIAGMWVCHNLKDCVFKCNNGQKYESICDLWSIISFSKKKKIAKNILGEYSIFCYWNNNN